MDLKTIVADIQAAQKIGDQIIVQVETYVPSVAAEAALGGVVLDLTAQMVAAALNAWSNASGQEITPEAIAALMPNTTPLSAPDAP